MNERKRRQWLASSGFCEPIASVSQQRAWCWIDNRTPPDDKEADGEFATHITWVNKAASWIGWRGASCFDAKDRPCRNGGDMRRAHEEGAFPVRWYWPERFPLPIIVGERILRIRKAVLRAGEDGATIEELRQTDGLKRLTMPELARAMQDRGVENQDGRWRLSVKSAEDIRFEIDCAFRASCVRN